MTTDPRAIYDAVIAELAATSPTTSGKLFGMPCLKNNGKALSGEMDSSENLSLVFSRL